MSRISAHTLNGISHLVFHEQEFTVLGCCKGPRRLSAVCVNLVAPDYPVRPWGLFSARKTVKHPSPDYLPSSHKTIEFGGTCSYDVHASYDL